MSVTLIPEPEDERGGSYAMCVHKLMHYVHGTTGLHVQQALFARHSRCPFTNVDRPVRCSAMPNTMCTTRALNRTNAISFPKLRRIRSQSAMHLCGALGQSSPRSCEVSNVHVHIYLKKIKKESKNSNLDLGMVAT